MKEKENSYNVIIKFSDGFSTIEIKGIDDQRASDFNKYFKKRKVYIQRGNNSTLTIDFSKVFFIEFKRIG